MSTVNAPNYSIDQTVRVFDQFYNYDVDVPAAEYDIVLSFFKQRITNPTAAANFTVNIFRVAESTGIPVLTLLDEFDGATGVSLNANLAYYLNQTRDPSTLLGVGVEVVPNFYAARNVFQ